MTINVRSVTVGSDIEVPLKTVTGEFFPVFGLVGGTKEEPRPLVKLGKGFFVQEDNVNLEFNIPPAKKGIDFETYVVSAYNACQRLLPPTVRLAGGESYVEYKAEFLQTPEAQAFGCQPDYNVYTGEENPRPRAQGDTTLVRTAAGHVHVGWENPTNEDREKLVKMLDITLGYGMLEHDDIRRRKMYGKAGSYRPKEYGIEYRVIGNFWVPKWASHVFHRVIRAIAFVNSGESLNKEMESALIEAINTGKRDDRLAREIIHRFEGIYA